MLFNKNCGCNRQMDFMNQPVNMQPGFAGQCPIVEPVINRCIEREFFHEVPHICPIHTHIINRHIYRHTYTPQYTCSEENQVINQDCGSCCNF